MSEEWKVQFSKKVGNDMWNFRGQTVYEVKAMLDEAFPKPKPSADAPQEASVVPHQAEASEPEPPSDVPMTPLEKARARMAAQKGV